MSSDAPSAAERRCFVNWPVVIAMMGLQFHLAWALVQAASSRSDSAKRLRAAFPEAFSDQPVRGPVSLLLLMEHAAGQNEDGFAEDLYMYDTLKKFKVPHVVYWTTEDFELRKQYEDHKCSNPPPDLDLDAKFGTIVEVGGAKFFVAADPIDKETRPFICLAPADLIHDDRRMSTRPRH